MTEANDERKSGHVWARERNAETWNFWSSEMSLAFFISQVIQ